MSSATNDTVTVSFDPNATSKQADIIGPASANKAGVMSALQAQQLAGLLPMTGKIVLENFNTWVDAVNGNDANDGRTEATAFKTITRAIADQPVAWYKDNIIWLKPGSYDVDPGDFDVFDPSFGHFIGDHGSPLAFIATDPEVFFPVSAVSSGTSASVTKTAAGWVVNAYRGMMCEVTDSTGFVQRASIVSNTIDTLQLQRDLFSVPDNTFTFRIIGASAGTELVASNFVFVMPLINGAYGMRDLQIRQTLPGFTDVAVDGTEALLSGCKIDLNGGRMPFRRGATMSFGTGLSGQWQNSDQGVPIFPFDWDCAVYIVNGLMNAEAQVEMNGNLIADDMTFNIGHTSDVDLFSPNTLRCTLNGREGGMIKLSGTPTCPAVLDTQVSADPAAGVLNLVSGSILAIDGPLVLQNSGGHGLLVDKTSYADLSGGEVSGAGNVGIGVALDRGAQLDVAVATLPTIIGGGGELQVGTLAPQAWATLAAPASFVDTTVLCRATSR